jgi:hypothetical protein
MILAHRQSQMIAESRFLLPQALKKVTSSFAESTPILNRRTPETPPAGKSDSKSHDVTGTPGPPMLRLTGAPQNLKVRGSLRSESA